MTGLATVAAPAVANRSTFHRYKYFTPGTKALLDEFIALFHPYSYIYKYEGQSWQSAKDPRWRLSPAEISKAICGIHNKFIGTRWGTHTRHAVLDIDNESPYHNLSSLKQLLATLAKAGFPMLSVTGQVRVVAGTSTFFLPRKSHHASCSTT